MRIRSASRAESSCAPPDSSGDAPLELAYAIACCHRLLRVWLTERLGVRGLSDGDFWVLWLCSRAAPNGFVQHELAAATGVSAAQMSGLVERLRQHGLLAGCRGDRDRRRQYWRLTTAGEDLLREIQAEIDLEFETWEGTCPVQDRQALIGSIRRLSETVTGPVTACVTAVRGSPDPARGSTDPSSEFGRPAVGGFGEVGRPAPSVLASLSPTEVADERTHRRAS